MYPGPAMRGRAHQGYNYEYRKQATSSGDQVENAQTITLQLREPKVSGLKANCINGKVILDM